MQSLLRLLPSEEVCVSKCMELGLFMRRLPDGDATHTAITLHPQTMKYNDLIELYKVQELWNEAVDNTARNYTFMQRALKETAESDANFTGKLLHILDVVYLQPADNSVIYTQDDAETSNDDDDNNNSSKHKKDAVIESQEPVFQSLMLGIFRTDYIRATDQAENDVNHNCEHHSSIQNKLSSESALSHVQSSVSLWKNVEINTVSVSFAGLAPLVQEFHKFLETYKQILLRESVTKQMSLQSDGKSANTQKEHQVAENKKSEEALYVNSGYEIPSAIAAAFHAWNDDASVYEVCDRVHVLLPTNTALETSDNNDMMCKFSTFTLSADESVVTELPLKSLAEMKKYLLPIVLVVTQEGERNTADQFKLLLRLTEKHKIVSLRRTFAEIHNSLQLYRARHNDNKHPAAPFGVLDNRYLISVIYFRNSYVPEDFPTEMHWTVRMTLEKLNAIKCPSIPYHLMTFKKLQQEMTSISNVLEPISFCGDSAKAQRLSRHFMPQYSLNKLEYNLEKTEASHQHVHDPEYWIQQAIAHPNRYVLKPQLEGGGNLIANDKMQKLLAETMPSDPLYSHIRREYILMEKIKYEPLSSVFMRQGKCYAMEKNVCSELGIYGVILSNGKRSSARESIPDSDERRCKFSNIDSANTRATCTNNIESQSTSPFLCNKAAGYLVRSKASNMEDGGVMAGVACLDSMHFIKYELEEENNNDNNNKTRQESHSEHSR